MAPNNDQSKRESGLLITSTVLLPATRLTFHFKGDGRRELVEEALYRDGHLVVARTETGAFEESVPPVGTLAEIVDAARPAPDRLMAVLGGAARVELGEISGKGAERSVAWRRLAPEASASRPEQVRAGDVLGLLDRLNDRGIEMAGVVNRQLSEASPSKVADIAASVAFDDVEVHQELLEEPDLLERLERVERQLDRLLEEMEA